VPLSNWVSTEAQMTVMAVECCVRPGVLNNHNQPFCGRRAAASSAGGDAGQFRLGRGAGRVALPSKPAK